MKTKIMVAVAALFVVFATGCMKDKRYGDFNNLKVSFTSIIQGQTDTRLTGNSWDSGDAIGVFMKQGSGLTNVLAANRGYTTSGNGNFSGSGAEAINYPESESVDFIAYYPYISVLSGNVLSIDVANQTDHSAIDVLYSNNATGLTRESGTVNLEFTHQLTKVELSLSAGSGMGNLDGLTVTFRNVNTTAQMNLETGEINGVGTPQDVQAKVTAQGANQVIEGILVPGSFGSTEVIFTLPSGSFIWTLPANTDFESGKKQLYNIVLQSTGSGSEVAVVGDATIVDWVSVPAAETVFPTEDPTTNPELVTGTINGNIGNPNFAFDLAGMASYAPGTGGTPGNAHDAGVPETIDLVMLSLGGQPSFSLPTGVTTTSSSGVFTLSTKNDGVLFKLETPTTDEIARFEALATRADLIAAFELEEGLLADRAGYVTTNIDNIGENNHGPLTGESWAGGTTARMRGADVGDILYFKSLGRNLYAAFRVVAMDNAADPKIISFEVKSILQ